MKFMHTSDLHIGKRLKNLSLIEDQKYILKQICDIATEEKIDALVVAGDVYDRSIPSTEGVMLLDEFLNMLSEAGIPLLMVSGNHDSPERLNFGSRLIEKSGIYISGQYDGNIKMKEINGVEFYFLPFIKPAMVKRYFPDEKIDSYEQAVMRVLEEITPSEKSVIISHQTVTCSGRVEYCESDKSYIGGEESVDYSVFDKFSYAALGHIHSPQSVGRETVRYCGTPLKYSKSEASHTKSVSIVEIDDNGVTINEKELVPLRDVRVIRGELDELLKEEVYSLADTEDYVYVVLTDETVEPNYISRIASVYPNYVSIELDRDADDEESTLDFEFKSENPLEIFGEFFKKQNNREMTEKEFEVIKEYLGGDE